MWLYQIQLKELILDMEFSKLSAPSLKELFVQELETMILSGNLSVGEKLPPERELAQSMQVSRAVVNGGISELAKKGFLTIKPRMGTFVADYRRTGTLETLISIMNYNGGVLRDSEVRSILEVRIALDTLAIELAVPHMSDDDILLLKDIIEQIQHAQTPKEASEIAFHFQHELAMFSGNALLPLIFHSFKVPCLSLWERFCRLYGMKALYENTIPIYHFIETRNVEGATSYIRDSIQDSIDGKKEIYF